MKLAGSQYTFELKQIAGNRYEHIWSITIICKPPINLNQFIQYEDIVV